MANSSSVKYWINSLFFLFIACIQVLSILFFLDKINIYKIISLMHISDLRITNYVLMAIQTKNVLFYLWIANLVLLPGWFLYNFYGTKKIHSKVLIKAVAHQANTEKLLSYMVTDSWGKIIWVDDLFKQVYKIFANFKDFNLSFIDILKANKDIEIQEGILDNLSYHFKLQQSGVIEIPIKIGLQNSVFVLSFMKIGECYLWQTMLVNQVYSINNLNFNQDLILNLPVPIITVNARGKTLLANQLFLKIFKIEDSVCENIDLSNFIVEKSTQHQFTFNNILSDDIKIDQCIFRDSQGREFSGYLIQSTCYKLNRVGLKYIRTVVLPLSFSNQESKYINNSLLGSIVEHSPFGIMVIDGNNQIVQSNEKVKNIFKILVENNKADIAEVLGRHTSYFLEQFNNSVNDIELDLQIDGETKFVKFMIYKYDASRIVYVIDMTYHKELESQIKLSQSLQAVGQLASAVAHDFNNLLTAIMSFTYFLQESRENEDPAMVELEQIKQNANRAKVMIKQLLTFSRKQELNPVVFDVNSEISDLMSTMIRLIGDRIQASFKRGKNVGKILMDKVQFHQVITNIVVNAKDAMKNYGDLEISTKSLYLKHSKEGVLGTIPPGTYVVIEIKDQGSGIRPENMKSIFQTHFSTKGDKGNGFGLATVFKIITDSAGFIDVHSKVGEGSSFLLYLPQNNQEIPQEYVDYSVPIQDLTGHETILLVEDEIPVRSVCARLLRSKGYNVIEAESGSQALEILRQQNIRDVSLIISDVMMPGLSGPETISKVRDIFPDIKAILMSGYAEDILEDINIDSSLKGIEFLAKPFTPDVFATKVKKIISKM